MSGREDGRGSRDDVNSDSHPSPHGRLTMNAVQVWLLLTRAITQLHKNAKNA